jgi:integrase
MSVYIPKKSRIWHYDFRFKGHRFCGSTGALSRRSAEAVERQVREDAALGRLTDGARLTLDQAAARWWLEVGARRRDAGKLEARVEALLSVMDRTVRLAKIGQDVVALAIETRRGKAYRRKPEGREFLPANATVNRDVVDILRPILKRARTHWDARGLPEIDWSSLRLAEPPELVRVYSEAEKAAWLAAAARSGWRGATATPKAANVSLALDLMLTYGLRFGELFFPLAAFDAEGPRLIWMKGRKGDVPHTVPLLARHGRPLAALVGRARAAGLAHAWFYPRREKKTGEEVLEPITPQGLKQRLLTAAEHAGVPPGRVIHGARHHAASAIVRRTGDLKMAQRLLGHRDIASTQRYVHLFEADLRAALEAGDSRAYPEPPAADEKKA